MIRILCLITCLLSAPTAFAQSSLKDDLAAIVEGSSLPAIAYAVIENGETTEAEVLGDAPRAALFRFGSISKTVTTALMLQLVEEGVLSLDDRLVDVVPDLNLEGGEDIRLIDLLEQTSGLPGTSYADYRHHPTDVSATALAQSRALAARWQPGQFFSYANVNHTLAAAMAEAATGRHFDELVEARVFSPLSMERATFDRSSVGGAFVSSYGVDGTEEPHWDLGVRPSGALIASIDDMARFTRFIATNETVVPRMRAPERALAAEAGYRYLYGAGLFPFIENENVYYGHWGRIDGFQAALGTNPETGSGFVLVTNGADRVAFGKARARVAQAIDGVPITLSELQEEDALDIDGWWVPFTDDNVQRAWISEYLGLVRAMRDAEALRLTPGLMPWSTQTLSATTGPNSFGATGFPVASHVFAADQTGEVFLLGDGQLSLRKIGTQEAYMRIAGLALFVISVVLSLVMGLWALKNLLFKNAHQMNVAWLAFGAASLAALALHVLHVRWGILGLLSDTEVLSRPSPRSILLLMLSLVWPLATLFGLQKVISNRRNLGTPAILGAVLVSGSFVASMAYLSTFGFIPLKTWG